MRVLVTGATGFLGFHLCRRLIETGHETTAVHRSTSRTEALKPLGVHFAECDLGDPNRLRSVIAGHDLVIHAAADIRSWSGDPDRQFRSNVEGAQNVSVACRLESVTRMIHVSSVSAIGIPISPTAPADEEFAFNLKGPRFHYHLTKKRAEEAVLEQVGQGLDAVIVNPGSLFGSWGSRYRGAEMILKVARGGLIPYFAGGRCLVHVTDAVNGLLTAANRGKKGERYILGGENVSYRDIAIRSAKALRVAPRMIPFPSPLLTLLTASCGVAGSFLRVKPPLAAHFFDNLFQYYSSEKARTFLDYSRLGFDEILTEFVSWRASQRSRAPEAVAI